ncbi:oxidoreductase [Spirochaetia bacterium]|nr:oxidoreductase [Spirochaetia bacterium]
MDTLRIGIVGLGSILPMHLTPIVHFQDSELVCVCDIKPDRVKAIETKYHVKGYVDYKEMIQNERIDAVHVCVPHYMHPIITNYALTKGVHVLSEKPMSINYEDGEKNVLLAKEMNLQYGVIFQCRYNTASQLVKKYLDNGALGKVLSARVVLTWDKPDSYYVLSDWKGTWDKEGGGVVIDQAIHSLDLANWFINDEIESVQANLSNRNHKIMEVDDSGEGFVKYKHGSTLGFWAMNNYSCDEPIEIRLNCEKGKAVLSYEKAEITLNTGEVISAVQQIDPDINYEGGKDYWGFQHIKQIRQFYDSVKAGLEPEISGREALKIQKLICAIYESSRTKRIVDLGSREGKVK